MRNGYSTLLTFMVLFLVSFGTWNEVFNHSSESSSTQSIGQTSPEGRGAYELARLADPRTGEIPENIYARELEFAAGLPSYASRDSLAMQFDHMGPYNVGGRTRAFAISKTNLNLYLAGAVSGGMWRSTNAGATWTRVTSPSDQSAVSCVSQDPRDGKTNQWYYGSGEVTGNSASKSYSAFFRGSGIYKSTNDGQTWTHLTSTAAPVNKASDWGAVFRVVVDPIRMDSDIVYAAIQKGIMRSNDGGLSWKKVLGSTVTASYSDLSISATGVYYATLSSDAGSASKGFWRSTDGVSWVSIMPSNFPTNHERTLISIYPGNENLIYFFSETPNAGTIGNSLWLYEYMSGDGSGSGGSWINRSAGLPNHDLNLYGGYCQVLAVKPNDVNTVFLGGTNLFRSTNGFQDTLQTTWIGGYKIAWLPDYSYTQNIHYPDQQSLFFHPINPNILISTNDGGIYRTNNCSASTFDWVSLNNGYVSSQFYGIGIDHGTSGSEEVMGGLQDRGTFWSNNASPSNVWTSVRGSDGAYVAIEDGGEFHYSSTQYGNVRRSKINSDGSLSDWMKVMPPAWPTGGGSGLLFVHPFTLDPAENNTMYLPYQNQVWRNTNLSAADVEDLSSWQQIASVSGTITAIAASESPRGVVYVGTSSKNIYRIDSAHTSNSTLWLKSDAILNGGYTSCIAIDPIDPLHVIVVYSNYNVVSLWESKDGGTNWESIEGNLKGDSDEGVPLSLYYIGNGPSMRWAEIVHTSSGQVVFLGTSVGLFSSRLIDGENTVWVKEGASTIGNVVVDMLDYRNSDQWLVVGTHGNGIYSSKINFDLPAQVEEPSQIKDSQFTVYPTPARDLLYLKSTTNVAAEARVLDSYGRQIRKFTVVANGSTTLDVKTFPSGVYYVEITSGEAKSIKKIIVQ